MIVGNLEKNHGDPKESRKRGGRRDPPVHRQEAGLNIPGRTGQAGKEFQRVMSCVRGSGDSGARETHAPPQNSPELPRTRRRLLETV